MPDAWREAAGQHAKWALVRAEKALEHDWERERVKVAAAWVEG